MNLKHFVKHAETVIAKNSPTILIGAGVAGCVTTAYLSWKAGRVHEAIVTSHNLELVKRDLPTLTRREEFEQTWKIYLVPATTGALSIGAIVLSHRIGSRRAAAMAAAYTVVTTDFDDYRKKIVEKMGEKKEKEARNEAIAERMSASPPPPIVVKDGKSWFCDLSTMRYFQSDRQFVEKARNDFNYKLLEEGYADLNEMYSLLGLDSTGVGGQLGWRAGDIQKNTVEVAFSAVLMPDGSAATGFQFVPTPKPDFDSFR